MDREALLKLKRAELQKLAKRDSVRAVGKSTDIVDGLLKKHEPLLVPSLDSSALTSEHDASSRKSSRRRGLIPMASGAVPIRRSGRRLAAKNPAPEAGPSGQVDPASGASVGPPRSDDADDSKRIAEMKPALPIQNDTTDVNDRLHVLADTAIRMASLQDTSRVRGVEGRFVEQETFMTDQGSLAFDARELIGSSGQLYPKSYERDHAARESQPYSSEHIPAGPSGRRLGPQIFPRVLPPLIAAPSSVAQTVPQPLPPSFGPYRHTQPRKAASNMSKPYDRPLSPRAPAVYRPTLTELRNTLEVVAPVADRNAVAQHNLNDPSVTVNSIDERAARLRRKTQQLQDVERHFTSKARNDTRLSNQTRTQPMEHENMADDEMEMVEAEETSREVSHSDLQ
ncbi:hypothetical protein C8Q77DRAFT_1161592 [Trametes polyzona]|nr:hypothetical protein C8Q77DRAFT_1161592 [Trametes polyzona]